MKTPLTLTLVLALALGAFAITPTPPPAPVINAPATPVPVGSNFAVSWDYLDPTGLTGYHVKYGPAPGVYPTVVDVVGGTIKTKAFTNFPLGRTYMVVTAYINTVPQIETVPSNELVLDVTPLPPSNLRVTSGGLVNISTRSEVGPNDDALIAGFILQGDESKRVVVRALGPSLPLPGKLASANLELHDGQGAIVASNNGWRTGPDVTELEALKIAPTLDGESALIKTLVAGNYTAIVRGPNATVGLGQVEVYDVTGQLTGQLP